MASNLTVKPPAWFWIAAIVLTLWNCMGVWSWYQHHTLGPAAMGTVPTDYDIQYFAKLPAWYTWLFAVATLSGLIGAVLLLARRALAWGVFIVSLAATVAMFGYTFFATDLMQVKGVWTAYFPAFIIAVCAFSVWFAGYAVRRDWLK